LELEADTPLALGYAALSRGDLDAFLAGLHEDAELHELAEMPDSAVYRGHDEIRRWAETGMAHLSDWEWVPEEILHNGDGVLVVRVRFAAHGAESGAPLGQALFHVIESRDGKATRIRGYRGEGEALAAAGLAG
jgi:ketosteroid isomerase-like protein